MSLAEGVEEVIARLSHKGWTIKEVIVENVTPTDDDASILRAAMLAGKEDRSNLFGWKIRRYIDFPEIVTVLLHTN